MRQLLRAHEYWRMKRLGVDLVIVNERASSYMQDLQSRDRDRGPQQPVAAASRRRTARQGSVYALRADLMSAEARALLQSVARVVLVARRGLDRRPARPAAPVAASTVADCGVRSLRLPAPRPSPAPARPRVLQRPRWLRQGRPGICDDPRCGPATPAPWINVIANPGFGFQVSAEGSGYTWAENSRENQLTPWSNDPVADPTGEAIYVRDETTGDLWSPTAQPIRDGGTYVARHGFGYSRFEHEANGIALELLQYVPLADPIKISRLTLRNLSGTPRRLSVTAYAEWVLGTSRGASGPFVVTEIDAATGAMLARNPWSIAFSGRVAFADLGGRQTAWTADRTEFLGRNGRPRGAGGARRNDAAVRYDRRRARPLCRLADASWSSARRDRSKSSALLGQCGSAEEAREPHRPLPRGRSRRRSRRGDEHWDSIARARSRSRRPTAPWTSC